MKVTMDDIASLSGISKATISSGLNLKQLSLGLSSQSSLKALVTIRKLNYCLDLVAVALSAK